MTRVPTTELIQTLLLITDADPDSLPNYQQTWRLIAGGKIRAVKNRSKHWMIDPVEAAKDLGLTLRSANKKSAKTAYQAA